MYPKRNLKARVEKIQLTHLVQRDRSLGPQQLRGGVLKSQPEARSKQGTRMKTCLP